MSKYESVPYFLTAGVEVTEGVPTVFLRSSGFTDDELAAIRDAFDEAFEDIIDQDSTGTVEKLSAEIQLETDEDGEIV
jgi:hypothetical protein